MMNILKAIISEQQKIFLKERARLLLDRYAVKSYSQEGEDMVLRRIFEKVDTGFYVDVGAHHPQRFSNTYFFYKKGWSGINIDAMPGCMNLFNFIRPRDINLEVAVSKERKEMTYYLFNEPALNTFDEKLASERTNDTYHVVKKQKIFTKTLKEILSDNLSYNNKISFLTIDVEGLDLEVVQSNDWDIYRPEYVLVEAYGANFSELQSSELYKFMINQKYDFFGKTILTIIFKDRTVC